ncbi:MAG: radical SAM protein [Pseudomonadota bacterium]
MRIIRDGKVFMCARCPVHGPREALVCGDADWFMGLPAFNKPGAIPLSFSTMVKDGCPRDCGLCPDHEQHACVPIIEVTNHCDLDCPICLVRNRHDWHISNKDMTAILDGLVAREGTLDVVNISGGEPTLHPDILGLVDLAASRPQITRVVLSTNGARLARDPDFVRELARRRVYVNLQFDGFDDGALRALRGDGDHAAIKRRALESLKTARVTTTLVATLARGVNEGALADCLRLLQTHDNILSVIVQPAAYTGDGGGRFAPHNPAGILTIPDVIRLLAEQSDGCLRRGDFLPMPCSHPSCFALTYLLDTEDGFTPLPRFLELDRYLCMIANRATIRTDDDLEDTMRSTLDDLWASTGQVPDSEKILRALRRAIELMYPADRRIHAKERIRLGEGMVKSIFIHAFMDEHTFDMDRVRKCCTHYALTDGRQIPGCVYNMLYRERAACPAEPSP